MSIRLPSQQHAPVLRMKNRHAPVPRAMESTPPCCAM